MQENEFENVARKMVAILSQPQCVEPEWHEYPEGHMQY